MSGRGLFRYFSVSSKRHCSGRIDTDTHECATGLTAEDLSQPPVERMDAVILRPSDEVAVDFTAEHPVCFRAITNRLVADLNTEVVQQQPLLQHFDAKPQNGRVRCGLCKVIPNIGAPLFVVAVTHLWNLFCRQGDVLFNFCMRCYEQHAQALVKSLDPERAAAVGRYMKGRLLLRTDPEAAAVYLTSDQSRKRLCNILADDDRFFLAACRRSVDISPKQCLLELALLRDCGSSHRLQKSLYSSRIDLRTASQTDVETLVVSSYVSKRPDLAYEKVWTEGRLQRAVGIVSALQNKSCSAILETDHLRPFSKQLLLEDYAFLCCKALMQPVGNRPPCQYLNQVIVNAATEASQNRVGSQWSFRYLNHLEVWETWAQLLDDVGVAAALTGMTLNKKQISGALLHDLFESWCEVVVLHTKQLIKEGVLTRGLFPTEMQKLGCEFRKSLVGTLVYRPRSSDADSLMPEDMVDERKSTGAVVTII